MRQQLLLTALCFLLKVHSQNYLWVSGLHAYGLNNVGYSIGIDKLDNSYIVGESIYYPDHSSVETVPFFCKYNSQGQLQWLDSLQYDCRSSVTDDSGNTYLACRWHLVKYDKDGKVVWDKTYKNFSFLTIALNPVLGMVAVGSVPGNPTKSMICAFTTNGSVLWERISDFKDFINVASCDTTGSTYVSFENTIKKIDAAGQEITSFTVAIAPFDVKANSTGDVITCGGHLHNANKNEYLLSLTKYDLTGIKKWEKTYIGGSLFPNSLEIDKNDNIYLAANFSNNLYLGTNTITGGAGEMLFLNFDTQGSSNWHKTTQGNGGVKVRSFCLNPSNDLFFTGGFGGTKTWDATTLTLPPDFSGLIAGRLSLNDAVGNIKNENLQSTCKIVPNPNNGKFEVQARFKTRCDIKTSIYDLNGRLISTHKDLNFCGEYSNSFDLKEVCKGTYFLEITGDGERIFRKLVIY